MAYVDGFVLPVPTKKLKEYTALARKAGKVWVEHGALEYRECVSDDENVRLGVPFPKLAGAKKGETVIFAWIVYKSKAHRDKVNAKAMQDPRLGCDENTPMPFDCQRMAYGGFKTLVESMAK